MTSQKAEALAKYTKAHEAGMMSGNWQPLSTMRFNLLTQESELSDYMAVIGDKEELSDYLKDQLLSTEKIEEFVTYVKTSGVITMEISNGGGVLSQPVFVRACPLTPRPGVLESSPVFTVDELRDTLTRIADKMLSVDTADTTAYEHGLIDPFGCIIVQRFVAADASAVVAPNSYIMMGDSHDGITAGSATLRLALPHQSDWNTTNNLSTLNIDPALIELEFISRINGAGEMDERVTRHNRGSTAVNHESYIVQLRGSSGHTPLVTPPAGVTINGSIPQGKVKVKAVHTVHNSGDEELARLEEMLRSDPPKGTVVSHIGTGASHLSHHAGQCRKYGVPYIVNEVKVGQQWQEVASGWVTTDMKFKPQPYNPFEYSDAFQSGLQVGLHRFARQHGWLSNHFHQFIGAPLIDPSNTAFFGGVFVGWLVNAGLSVSTGELRHSAGMRNEKHTYMTPLVVSSIYGDRLQESHSVAMSQNRKHYYMAIEDKPITLDSIIALLKWTSKQYYGGWSGGYGGAKYKKSVDNTLKLAQAIKRYLKKPTEQQMLDVIGEANMCENNIHNTGFFFNKFLSKTALDWGTNAGLIELNPAEFFRVYYAAYDAYQHRDADHDSEDVTHIFKYVENITNETLQSKPIFLRSDLPQEMRDLEEKIVGHGRFHGQGAHGYTDDDAFIPCGSSHCVKCKDLQLVKFKRALPLYNVSSVTTNVQALSYPEANTVDETQSNIMYAGVVILKQVMRTKAFNPTTDFIIKTLKMGDEIQKNFNMMTDYHKVKAQQAFANFYSLTMDKPVFIEALETLTQEEE
tara:strand:- start:482 stop:2881 length:2400 start_codon:yes stop_codon:yes gene_type:complete